jgi:catalase
MNFLLCVLLLLSILKAGGQVSVDASVFGASYTTDNKTDDLEGDRLYVKGTYLTTDQGSKIAHTDDSLKAGVRGPVLIEDFHFREKLTQFDHERIPERVVHARGTGAHGYFELYKSLSDITKAGFLTDTSRKTPVFVRFSTVQGSKGSADTVRDVRGFATKFYTAEGVFDIVGNNVPVFFIQDGIKFPDFVHAVKPEPRDEMPQGGSAHNNFWDFVGLVPESAHMVMWAMSDRGIPRSYSLMEGFGVHTFRLINDKGVSSFVKWHWKPVLGMNSLVWDEAQKIAGKDPDFHRRDLYESIDNGNFPEFELGLQVMSESEAETFMDKHNIDILDATKLWPEEEIPVRRVGKMVLNRNTDNFFAETEQVAFCVSHIVPGIGFTNDPMLQARLFSYLDTQITRLGGPNFKEIPINRPLSSVSNHQQDGAHRMRINTQRANYFPNSIDENGDPNLDTQNGFKFFPEMIQDGSKKIAERSESFKDHFTQAALFWISQTEAERVHIRDAFCFELGKVGKEHIKKRYVNEVLVHINMTLAENVAKCLSLSKPSLLQKIENLKLKSMKPLPSLSILSHKQDQIKNMKVAVLVAPGFEKIYTSALYLELKSKHALMDLICPTGGLFEIDETDTTTYASMTFATNPSVIYDAVFVPGGKDSIRSLQRSGDAASFIREAYRHGKPIGGHGTGAKFIQDAIYLDIGERLVEDEHLKDQDIEQLFSGVILENDEGSSVLKTTISRFIDAMKQRRYFDRNRFLVSRY